MKDCHTCTPSLTGSGRAVARGISDLGPNIPFKWLRILPGVMIVVMTIFCLLARNRRQLLVGFQF
jgi:hypothetical protein